ncbi:hypothetical protein WICPIJ_007584 [Wickerhamomyces pijperi]|uniref:Uncharacterized protein n=1 Tax=Wickerhamomyces pijperi TaxID=599730 RepID=A0A9P8Q073_WICPI|nr:hypothetical protein WICPIJ_007584 [Wickerhamomyces pijperi]
MPEAVPFNDSINKINGTTTTTNTSNVGSVPITPIKSTSGVKSTKNLKSTATATNATTESNGKDKDIPTLLKETADSAPSKLRSNSTNADATTITPGVTLKDKLIDLFNQSTLRNVWFLGNLLTLISGLLYFFTFFSSSNVIWYKLSFLGACLSFGGVIHQTKVLQAVNGGVSRAGVGKVLGNDNVHYLYCALLWLIIPFKTTTLSLVPFVSFSTFHVLNFLATDVLSLFEPNSKMNEYGVSLKKVCRDYHELPRKTSAFAEILTLFYLILNALFWRRWSWVMLSGYVVFIKLKSESSVFTKIELKNWEVRIDGIVSGANNKNVPPMVRNAWLKLKNAIKSLNSWKLIETAANEVNKGR